VSTLNYTQKKVNNATAGSSQQPSGIPQKTPKANFDESELEPQKQFFEELLHKLDTERQSNADVYCDEKQVIESSNYNDMLYGVHAASKMSDIVNENIFIELINSQVKLSLEEDPSKQIVNQNNPSTNFANSASSASKPTNSNANNPEGPRNLKGKKSFCFQ
jgi:hypothetical protein